MEELKALLHLILSKIVSMPSDIRIELSDRTDEKGEYVLMSIRLNVNDLGVCIGEGGLTAEALRRIINVIGYSVTNKRVYIKIISATPS